MNSLEEELEDGEIRQEQPPEAAVNAPVLSKKQQKKLAKQEKKQNQIKSGFLDVYGGENAFASIEIKHEVGDREIKAIRMNDVQQLILWALGGETVSPSWVFLKNKPMVKQVVVLLAHGLSASSFEEKQGLMPNLSSLTSNVIKVQAHTAFTGPSQGASNLLNVFQNSNASKNSSNNNKRKHGQDNKDAAAGSQGRRGHPDPPFPPSHYILTPDQMASVKYPMPTLDELSGLLVMPEGFLPTRPFSAQLNQNGEVPPPPPSSVSPAAQAADSEHEAKESLVDGAENEDREEGEASDDGESGRELKRRRINPSSSSKPGRAPYSLSTRGNKKSKKDNSDSKRQEQMPKSTTSEKKSLSSWPVSEGERMVALDCEMCVTDQGLELTRLTLVDSTGRVLIDDLVLPHNPITDYVTRYSGINEEMMKDVTTRLEDVREKFFKFVHAETLLCGHSLENDLKVLKVIHSRLIDTVFLYPHPKGPPARSALKVLAQRFLKRKIQEGSHDSVIDARTALDLVHLKIKNGPAYGTPDYENANTLKLVDILGEKLGRRCCLVDRKDVLNKFATGSCSAIAVSSDGEAVEKLAKEVTAKNNGSLTFSFLFSQLLELSEFQAKRATRAQSDYLAKHQENKIEAGRDPLTVATAADALDPESQEEAIVSLVGDHLSEVIDPPLEQDDFSEAAYDAILSRIDGHIGRIISALPTNSILMVVTGNGDAFECRRAQEMKMKRQGRVYDYLPLWNLKEEEDYSNLINREITGLCFCQVGKATIVEGSPRAS